MRILIALVLAGCGGGGKQVDPPGNKMSDAGGRIADAVTLSALKDADQEALCDQLYVLKAPETVMQASCHVAGLGAAEGKTDGELRASCKKETSSCLASPKPPSAACAVYELVKTPACAALTVGALRACVTAGADVVTRFVKSDPCTRVTVTGDRLAEVRALMATPQCEVFEKCGNTAEGDAEFQKHALQPVIGFRDQICACADKACAIKVDDEFRLWDATLELTSDAKPGPETEKKLKDTLDAYRACLGKHAPERNTH